MELGSVENTLNIALVELGIAATGLALHLEVYLRIIKKVPAESEITWRFTCFFFKLNHEDSLLLRI